MIIAGNWKMNHGQKETYDFFNKLEKLIGNQKFPPQLQIMIFPPFLSIEKALDASKKLPIQIGAQNIHWNDTGAFTGEISTRMAQEIGVRLSLVGHSERRQFFGETDETVFLRATQLLKNKFKIILCIGETQKQREQGQTETVLTYQLEKALRPGSENSLGSYIGDQLIIAYEPVWAIGTGLTATPKQANEAHQTIRDWITQSFSESREDKIKILYGGSVNPNNIEELLSCPHIDGALIGGASLQAESFFAMITTASQQISE